jgi:hypothetical protein
MRRLNTPVIAVGAVLLMLVNPAHAQDADAEIEPWDEECYTLSQVVRQLATLHQYGGDADAFISGLVANGVAKDKIISYRRIAADIATSPVLISEPDREYAIDYHVEFYEALCR